MVFRGKPSKAPCRRAKVVCHGYRDTQQLRVHDETKSVQHRVFLPRSLQQPIETQARDAFLAHYVAPVLRGWDFLAPVSVTTPSYLLSSLDAVSLAYLAHLQHSPSILGRARSQYSTALRLMNKALLPSSGAASKHSMLTGTMLLDLFEKITHSGPSKVEFWRSHIDGSLALIQALGLDYFRDYPSLRILSRLVTNCIISCVTSATAVPQQLIEVRAHLTRQMNLEDPKWKHATIMIEYAAFREALQKSVWTIPKYIFVAQDIDQRLLDLSQNMPKGWEPEVHVLDMSLEIPSRLLFYRDRHVTQMVNALRLVRILLNEFLLESYQKQDGINSRLFEEPAIRAITSLIDDICASIPQYVRCQCQFSTRPQQHSPTQTLDCQRLLFPLYVAGRSRWASLKQRAWIMQQLRHIHAHFGLHNSSVLVKLLESQMKIDPWNIYAMLGSYGFAA
ncbi:hypothetical protein N7510_001086 [Penicillium lagena]|uniref:uncharacterized protein n=1 Tax=Penicillium lagena TaxID=94218 RepID=UPI002541835D|nr:uncharacterized protein N7510_001086 [Penicillium lagena]KAJ5624777.1 hypothetical protein N7510_001086 [Penicillium lagena]